MSSAIISDQGRIIENDLTWEMCELAQVHELHTTPYHPKGTDSMNASTQL